MALGHVAFVTSLKDGNGDDVDNPIAMFRSFGAPDASPALVAREGSSAFGLGSGIDFQSFGTVELNAAGDVAFEATLQGASVNDDNDTAIFTPRGGPQSVMDALAREGSPAPGVDDNAVFAEFIEPEIGQVTPISFSNNADVTFAAKLRTGENGGVVDFTNELAIFGPLDGPNSPLTLLAREADVIPGAEDGAAFARPLAPVINDMGHVVFASFLTNSEGIDLVDSSNNFGLFAWTDGELTTLVRKGDLVTVELDDKTFDDRTVSSISFDGRGYYGETGLNDSGTVAFRLAFTNGTQGIFTTELASVPEPSGIALASMLFGLPLLLRRRRRRE